MSHQLNQNDEATLLSLHTTVNHLPYELTERILKCLPMGEIARLRCVNSYFNEIAQRLLNERFWLLDEKLSSIDKEWKRRKIFATGDKKKSAVDMLSAIFPLNCTMYDLQVCYLNKHCLIVGSLLDEIDAAIQYCTVLSSPDRRFKEAICSIREKKDRAVWHFENEIWPCLEATNSGNHLFMRIVPLTMSDSGQVKNFAIADSENHDSGSISEIQTIKESLREVQIENSRLKVASESLQRRYNTMESTVRAQKVELLELRAEVVQLRRTVQAMQSDKVSSSEVVQPSSRRRTSSNGNEKEYSLSKKRRYMSNASAN